MNNYLANEIPQDFESEQAVLGLIMYDNDTIYPALKNIKEPSYFYTPAHQYIFRAQIELLDKKLPIEEFSIADELKKLNQLDEVGGLSYLTSLIDCVPSSMNMIYYSGLVAKNATLRRLITVTTDTAKKSRDPEIEPAMVIDETIEKLMDLRSNIGDETLVKSFASLMPEIREETERAGQGKVSYGISSGYDKIDMMTGGGFQKTELVIIGARPSVGKTSLAMCAGYQVAYSGKNAFIISLESKEKSLARDRLLPSISGIQSYTFRTGKLDQGQWDNFDNILANDTAMERFKVCDKSGMNCNDIYSLAKIEYEQHGLELLIVDFIQMIKSSKKHSTRNQELGEIAERLKDIAKDFNIPVIALSQLNREVEKSKRKPNYADLRDSGELEQIADVIILLHQEENPDDERIYDLIFGKNRNGRKGTVNIKFIKEYTRFQDA